MAEKIEKEDIILKIKNLRRVYKDDDGADVEALEDVSLEVIMIPNGLSGSASHVAVEDIISWWYENRADKLDLSAEHTEQPVDPELEALLEPDAEQPEDQEPLPEAEILPQG